MKIIRHAFVFGGFILGLLFLSPEAAYSQVPPPRTYLFVEVKDTAGKALAEADVAVAAEGRGPSLAIKTDKDGVAKHDYSWSPYSFYNLLVSKSGYLPSEHVFFLRTVGGRSYYGVEGFPERSEKSQDSQTPPIKVVLHKAPLTETARQAAAIEIQKRQLLLAVKKGHTASLRQLLAAGVKADTTDDKGVPAIAWAAFVGHAETIKELLAAGADVRNKTGMGREALLIYLIAGIAHDKTITRGENAVGRREEVVRKFVEAGADVNLNSPWGMALTSVITQLPYPGQPPSSLSPEAVRFLIASGANVNANSVGGQTPLMTASMMGSTEVVRMLLEAGADASVNAKDADGKTALLLASQMNHLEIVRTLLKTGADVNVKDSRGQTPLMLAPRSRYVSAGVETVRVLLAAGARVNESNSDGQTALMLAVQAHDPQAIKVLLDAGADVSVKDKHGKTALLYVESQLHDDASAGIVRMLIAAGANVNEVGGDGQTPLMLAAKGWWGAEVKLLLEAGARASVNARDKEGRTALMLGSKQGASERIKTLLGAGADINARDNRGRTPLMYAVLAYSGPEVFRTLHAAGARVNDVDEEGQTALMLATQMGSVETVKTLLELGASVNARDSQGRTALIIASQDSSYTETVGALIEAGADVNATDNDGRTALLAAVTAAGTYLVENIRQLLAAGAKVGLADKQGRTALMLAKKAGSSQMIALLEQAEARH